MRTLVTGGAGFIGSHVVRLLLEAGHQVAVLDDLSAGRPERVPQGVSLHRVQLEEAGAVDEVVAQVRPQAVFHLAAQVDVQAAVREPLRDLTVNVAGSLVLLEACRRNGVEHLVYSSSAAVYGEPERLPLPEEAACKPLSPYGASKLAAEGYCWVYGAGAGLRTTVLRYANVYGPGQEARAEGGVVASFATRLAQGEPPRIFGSGRQTRDFIYVTDVARANLAALEGPGGLFNVGTGRERSVLELAQVLLELAGRQDLQPRTEPARPGEIERSALDPGRAGTVLGWHPRVDLREGLARTLAWTQAGSPMEAGALDALAGGRGA
ncbi:NAD-dependent epimerase/dehydratase family protein [Limnochorda pilosa]|uniref:UDP-glucose 4-epimerase n=1 Tax=Limnochorda pilosa TaxID=1555112 RepID=A0A0K2SP39_LIMPI|nr:NAD-dependent epimerase/dehydratase family protein [Limnochorda pilosa]BAS28885.1 UDP-glucose 4-epimerase [Limnochorda pilosa]